MRTFKLALAAGVSIVVATKFSPAFALPAFPLDANGAVRQGDMCIAQREPHAWNGLFDDTGPGMDADTLRRHATTAQAEARITLPVHAFSVMNAIHVISDSFVAGRFPGLFDEARDAIQILR